MTDCRCRNGHPAGRHYAEDPALLDQDAVWVDAKHRTHQIAYMDRTYRENVCAFLLSPDRPALLEFFYSLQRATWVGAFIEDAAEQAGLDVDREEDYASQRRAADPGDWLRSTKLFQRMSRELPEFAERRKE